MLKSILREEIVNRVFGGRWRVESFELLRVPKNKSVN